MNTLSTDDMRRVIGYLPKDVIQLMRAHPICLAGGFLRAKVAGEIANDIDLFCETKEAADTYATALADGRQVKVWRTKNAFTVISPPRQPVQFIHRWTFTNPEALIQSFDFTVAKAALWFDREVSSWRSMVDARFYPDLAARRMTYTFPQRNEDAGGSLLRVQKFLGRGYHISPEQFGCVIARLLDGVREESGFWQSEEKERAAVLVGLLRQADPLTVIDGLDVSDDSLETPPAPEPILPEYVG
jgi:hypothetical protein